MNQTQKQSKSMDTSIITHSISQILPYTKSLTSLVSRLARLSEPDIKQLVNDLEQINDIMKKVKHSQVNDELLSWLQNVKEAIINFHDLMEDIHYKDITFGPLSFFSWVFNIRAVYRVSSQVKNAAEKLKTLSLKGKDFSLSENEEKGQEEASSSRELARDVLDKSPMVGRENDKKEIIDKLLKLNSAAAFSATVPVFSIVGVPGIGKTKLARHVSEDEQVKAHFGFGSIWFDTHHEPIDVDSIVKRDITAVDEDSRRYLIVLDDLRIETKDDLEKLKQKLTESAGGTSWFILVTTRSNHVANSFCNAKYVLKGLNEQESQSLFEQIREPSSTTNEWEMIGKDCGGGVPLVIGIMATLMNLKGGKIAEVEHEVVKELKFIYYEDLPTYQKLCFAYCSLFPEDYLFDAERLIQLWTAEGFLIIPGYEFGRACFEDFVPWAFQRVKGKEEEEVYRMNRSMHKLGKEVSGDENIIVDSNEQIVKGGTLRASINFSLDLSCGISNSVLDKSNKVRSILLTYKNPQRRLPHEVKMTTSTIDKIFKCSLRVLDLHDLGIKIVPTSIEMKYLRYLDLSHNNIDKLPSSITKLIHLQTLKLSYCHVLKELPKDLQTLTQLNHLDIEGCLDLTRMPSGINNLTSLQTLSLFVASKKHSVTGGLTELTGLNNLRGNLEILHLEQVKLSPSSEAGTDEYFLKNKQDLRRLTLRWDHDDNQENSSDNDDKLLECLQPHTDLRVLFVVGYNGITFSSWLNSLQNLVKFTLNDCPSCTSLPPMDQLPYLKVVHLRRLTSLEYISKNTSEPDVDSSSSTTPTLFFLSLKELIISDCPNLKSWWEKDEMLNNRRPSFTSISKLHIRCCPKLACMPLCTDLDEELVLVDSNVRSMRKTDETSSSTAETSLSPLSKLKSMVIERIEESLPHSWLQDFTSLEKLQIRDCSNLKSLPKGFKSLSSLKSLSIERCQEFDLETSEVEWEGLKNLESLTLRSIPKLKYLTSGIGNVTSLKDLSIYDCHGLTLLPENIGHLTSLCTLVISECKSLESLPKGMKKMSSLLTLNITDCPLLLPRCQPETGDDWPQIAHIKHISIRETSQDLRD